jgi:hypothetical protein
MFLVGDTEYPLCLLDTMAISEMVKRPEGALRHFYEWAMASKPCFVPCFSPFTLIELRRKPALFDKFIEQFHPLPCVLLKGYEWLLEDEILAYPNPSKIDPCALAFTPMGDSGNLLRNLPSVLKTPAIVKQERQWNGSGWEIVNGMRSLVPNFPPDGAKYKREQIRLFIEVAGFSQLALRNKAFARRTLDRDEAVQIDAFPSLKASLYTTFYKFYVDTTRKPSESDAFDIIIAAGLPYVEAVITERHQVEVLRKTKRHDSFINELRVFTLRDFRDHTPPN